MNRLTTVQINKINTIVCTEKGYEAKNEDVDMDVLEDILSITYAQNEKGFYIYPDVPAKAAKLACEIASKKPFANFNLATAVVALVTLMEINNFKTDNMDIDSLNKSIKEERWEEIKYLLIQ